MTTTTAEPELYGNHDFVASVDEEGRACVREYGTPWMYTPGDRSGHAWDSAREFPSPRGVELHKPQHLRGRRGTTLCGGFRPLAGLSCINLAAWSVTRRASFSAFPSPRGVELHKPLNNRFGPENSESKFPSPRGVELHKPHGSICAQGV